MPSSTLHRLLTNSHPEARASLEQQAPNYLRALSERTYGALSTDELLEIIKRGFDNAIEIAPSARPSRKNFERWLNSLFDEQVLMYASRAGDEQKRALFVVFEYSSLLEYRSQSQAGVSAS